MLLTLFGCGGNTPETTQAPTTTATAPAEALELRYDDHLMLSELTDEKAPAVTISQQSVTSKVVGTDNADESVLTYNEKGKCIIATGTGTATLEVAGKVYEVTVTAAPISLFMITGHSVGAGHSGEPPLSVVCADGMAYSSHGPSALRTVTELTGIGYNTAEPIPGINAFNEAGSGSPGEASAIAWQWIQDTGEKVWVLNSAISGSCVAEWIPGEKFYEDAVALFKTAQTVLKNEVAAGHFIVKDMAIIYHGGTNFVKAEIGKNITYTQDQLLDWYMAMWNGFKTEFTMDINGTGTPQTVSHMGLVPIFTHNYVGGFFADVPMNFYLAASNEYSDIFMASEVGRRWLNDADIQKYFPDVTYSTHVGVPQKLTQNAQIYYDGVHYRQLAYNALGFDVATNLHTALRGEFSFTAVEMQDFQSTTIADNHKLYVGERIDLVPQVMDPGYGNLEFHVSGNVRKSFPCTITATAPGSGKLEIVCNGEVVKTITFTIM